MVQCGMYFGCVSCVGRTLLIREFRRCSPGESTSNFRTSASGFWNRLAFPSVQLVHCCRPFSTGPAVWISIFSETGGITLGGSKYASCSGVRLLTRRLAVENFMRAPVPFHQLHR